MEELKSLELGFQRTQSLHRKAGLTSAFRYMPQKIQDKGQLELLGRSGKASWES